MVVLESYTKHNMVAYLEKTDGNAEFHEIIDFLTRSSIHHALTVSLVVSTTFVEQFWMSAKSKIINNVRHITAKVAGKPVSISEASIRSDLLFDDVDGIDSLPNQAIFDAIQLMGHLDAKKKFVMYLRFISIFLDTQLMNVPVPLDHFPINALTSKVFSFMVKKGKHFSGKVTPLFASMLVQPTEDEGATSERPFEPQPAPSPPHPSEANVEPQSDLSPRPSPTTNILDSIPAASGGNHRDQAKQIKHLKAQIKKLKKQAKPVITHHKAWLKSVSLKERLAAKKSLKKQWIQKEYVSKQGRKPAKAEPLVHKDPAFDELANDTVDYIESENAQDEGRTRSRVSEEKETADDEVSTKDVFSTAQQQVSTDKEKVSTDRPNVSTDRQIVSTDKEEVSTDRQNEGTGAQTDKAKAVSREKEKGVELKDVEETERPRPTSTRSLLTLKPLPKIDPKDKGKKKIEEEDESDSESDGIPEAKKKFKQLASDEEMARKVQEEWETKEERQRLAEEQATNDALIRNYDDIKARIEADRLLAERLQEKEREQFTVEERAKFLHDIIAAQRKFLAQQRNFKHSDLKTKKFKEIQALYEQIKRSDEDFIAIGSAEDERMIKEMNEKGIDSSNDDSVKEKVKEEDGTKKRKSGHIKMIARKKTRPLKDVDSDEEHRRCLKNVIFDSTIDTEVMETKSIVTELHKVSSPDGGYLGDIKVMMESSIEENDLSDFWEDQQKWVIVTWRLYEACGVYILELKDGTIIHMLVERRYPLSKDLLQRMLDLGLEVERESTVALDLIRFIKQQIDEK
ncbi:hypothetical protein Tco_0264367 [Tanacetum coccineum]